MVYNEIDAVKDLTASGLPFFRTGSREICDPAPTDTDVDFVVLDLNRTSDFERDGYPRTTKDQRSRYGGPPEFNTYRRGEVNLIVVHSWGSFDAWRAATAAAKQMNLLDKVERIALFQGVLYGNWPDLRARPQPLMQNVWVYASRVYEFKSVLKE